MHSGQKADLSLLQRKGRSKKNVCKPMGKTARSFWTTPRLDTVAGSLATYGTVSSPRNQLGPWFRIMAGKYTILVNDCE